MEKSLKFIILSSMLILCGLLANADNKHSLGNGVNLVQYGNTWVIEDDNRQMSINVEIAQDGIDRKNNEMMYNVICNGSVKKVAKWGLKGAIAAGIKYAAPTYGSSLAASAIALAADIIYDEACAYWNRSISK